MSSGRLGDVEFFSVDEIDGERWLNTYDLVDLNEDGSLTYVGRMNKYFVNNEGVRFDAGLVETAMKKQRGIVSAGLAGEYEKLIHDTIPVLYVTCAVQGPKALHVLHDALVAVFVREGGISQTNLPGQCVICEDIPHTPIGKVDVHQIMNGSVKGDRYKVQPVYSGERLVDVQLAPAAPGPGMWAGLPEELDPQRRH
jgi:non-ribosomal peptide synthetase component E (peptide arylation enzyme)